MGLLDYFLIAFYLGLCVLIALIGRQHKYGRIRLFFISFFTTPITGAAIVFYRKKVEMTYRVNRYKCPRCDYKFDHEMKECPLCMNEGYLVELTAVNQIMT